MWKIEYCPDSKNKQNPLYKILAFKKPLSTQVLKKLEICRTKEDSSEWPGTVKTLKTKGSNYRWKQWRWRESRIHFYEDIELGKIIILNAFKKDQDNTMPTHIIKSEDNYKYYLKQKK